MKRDDLIRLASWAIPVVCLLLGAVLAVGQWQRYTSLEKEREATSTIIASIRATIADVETTSGQSRVAVVPRTRDEEMLFLEGLRRLASQNGVRVLKWVNEERRLAQGQADPSGIPGVATYASNFEVAGPYESVRRFAESLLNGQRLYILEHASWTRMEATGETTLSGKILRFTVDSELTGVPTTAARTGSVTAPF